MTGWVRFDPGDESSWPAVEPGVRGLDVLIYEGGKVLAVSFYVDRRRDGGLVPVFEDDWGSHGIYEPSHWMPWPAPPVDAA